MTKYQERKISFVIIGKNEGWKITQCIESVYKALNTNKLHNFEIIYVDSKSNDDSLERAMKFSNLKIFQITGKCNAAVARNIGAKESSGEILCFLDGDMEIMPDFIDEIFNLFDTDIKYISGQIEECFYDESWNYIGNRKIFSEKKLNKFDQTNGGAFVISKSLWESVSGMRTKFDRSQDIDLTYRLIKKGNPIFRSNKTFVKHHTIQYNFKVDFKKELSLFRNYLYRGLLLRENLFNPKIIKRNLRINYTLILLIISILLASFISKYFLILYLGVISLRSFSQYQRFKKAVNSSVFSFFLKIIYLDINGIIGALFFFPKSHKIIYTKL